MATGKFTIYFCTFTHLGIKRMAWDLRGPVAFKEGFWINLQGQFTRASDAHMWIPPGQIAHIEKVPDWDGDADQACLDMAG